MEVLSLQIFVSLMLVLGSVLLFVHAQKGKVHEQADRLALLPLEGDERAGPATNARPTTVTPAKESAGAPVHGEPHEEQR
jgi:hypothetical protein